MKLQENTHNQDSKANFLDNLRVSFFRMRSFITALDRLFGIDSRSLSLFRILLSILLIVDLSARARYITAFYTDQGILSRSFLIDYMQNAASFSVHLANGTFWFQALLFLFALVVALAMLFGYRTRAATFLSWALLASLHVRNPDLKSSGDDLLRLLLFWSMFLPTGLHWSFDRASATNENSLPGRILSFATAALLIQAALVYVFTALLKTGAPWQDGSAVWLALNWDQGTTQLGRALLEFPSLLTLITQSVVWFELVGGLLLFLPVFTSRVRLCVLLLFLAMHLGFATTMYLGTFPFVSIASLTPFLPSSIWTFRKHALGEGTTVFYDGGCGFCHTMVLLIRTFFVVPKVTLKSSHEDAIAERIMARENSWIVRDPQGKNHTRAAAMRVLLRASPLLFPLHFLFRLKLFARFADQAYKRIASNRPTASKILRWVQPRPLRWKLPLIGQIAVGVLLSYVLIWNLAGILDFRAPMQSIAQAFQLQQRWSMFSPYPRLSDGWFVVPGILENGEEVDVFKDVISSIGHDLSWDKPESVAATFPNVYWRKYLEYVSITEDLGRYQNFSRYLCRTWNGSHTSPETLTHLQLYYVLENTRDLASPPQRQHLWQQDCPDDTLQ